MEGLEVRLTGSLEKFGLSDSIKKRIIKRAERLAGDFVRFGSCMIKMPFKIPFVKYQEAELSLESTSLDYPHVHLMEPKKVIYIERKLLGYKLA